MAAFFCKWSYFNYADELNKPDLVSLAQNIYKSDFQIENKLLASFSLNKIHVIENEIKLFRHQNRDLEILLKYNSSMAALWGGKRIKLFDEESILGWVDILLGVGINRFSYIIDGDKSLLNSEYKYEGVGYNYEVGGFESFRKYNLENNSNFIIPAIQLNLNTPLYYWSKDLYFSIGLDFLYLDVNEEVTFTYDIKDVPYDEEKEIQYRTDTIYNYKIENSKFNISPSFFANYKIMDNLTLKLGGSLFNIQASILTDINF